MHPRRTNYNKAKQMTTGGKNEGGFDLSFVEPSPDFGQQFGCLAFQPEPFHSTLNPPTQPRSLQRRDGGVESSLPDSIASPGAWSPIGDVTTTMLWIRHKISTTGGCDGGLMRRVHSREWLFEDLGGASRSG